MKILYLFAVLAFMSFSSCTNNVSRSSNLLDPLHSIENDLIAEGSSLSSDVSCEKDVTDINATQQDSLLRLLCSISINERIDTSEIISFISLYDDYPFSSVEISEFANEILYILFQRHTELIVNEMSVTASKMQFGNMLLDLQNPVCDTFNIRELIFQVQKLKSISCNKDVIIRALENAQLKVSNNE